MKNKRNLGGQLGAPEYMEEVQTVRDKVQQLADAVRHSMQALSHTTLCLML